MSARLGLLGQRDQMAHAEHVQMAILLIRRELVAFVVTPNTCLILVDSNATNCQHIHRQWMIWMIFTAIKDTQKMGGVAKILVPLEPTLMLTDNVLAQLDYFCKTEFAKSRILAQIALRGVVLDCNVFVIQSNNT